MRRKIAARWMLLNIKHEGFVTYGDNKILPFSLCIDTWGFMFGWVGGGWKRKARRRKKEQEFPILPTTFNKLNARGINDITTLFSLLLCIVLTVRRMHNYICGFHCLSIDSTKNELINLTNSYWLTLHAKCSASIITLIVIKLLLFTSKTLKGLKTWNKTSCFSFCTVMWGGKFLRIKFRPRPHTNLYKENSWLSSLSSLASSKTDSRISWHITSESDAKRIAVNILKFMKISPINSD